MRKSIILLAICAVMLQGCDFVRSVAGRPTSETVAQMRQRQIEELNAAHQARMDSLKRVQQAMADSLAALEAHLLDSLTQAKGTLVNPSKMGGLYTTKLQAKYCIVVGAFRARENAERKLKACKEAGYPEATMVSFRNGLMAVAVCPSDNLQQTVKTVKKLRGNGICPKDGWILVNE